MEQKYILSTVENQPIYEHLRTIPGVGKILALTIYYEVGEIARFGSARQFCSYARVDPLGYGGVFSLDRPPLMDPLGYGGVFSLDRPPLMDAYNLELQGLAFF
jgi:hypothetical protein